MRRMINGLVSLAGLVVAECPAVSRGSDPEDSMPIDVLMDRSPPRPLVRIDATAVAPFQSGTIELGCFLADETRIAMREYQEIGRGVAFHRVRARFSFSPFQDNRAEELEEPLERKWREPEW